MTTISSLMMSMQSFFVTTPVPPQPSPTPDFRDEVIEFLEKWEILHTEFITAVRENNFRRFNEVPDNIEAFTVIAERLRQEILDFDNNNELKESSFGRKLSRIYEDTLISFQKLSELNLIANNSTVEFRTSMREIALKFEKLDVVIDMYPAYSVMSLFNRKAMEKKKNERLLE
jgi:hypothetical protein